MHISWQISLQGSKYLFKNDKPLPPPERPEILTDRQTDEAMRVIKEQVSTATCTDPYSFISYLSGEFQSTVFPQSLVRRPPQVQPLHMNLVPSRKC